MLDTILKNKKLLIATAIVIVLAIVLLLLTKSNSQKDKLVLYCKADLNQDVVSLTGEVNIYENNNSLVYKSNSKYVYKSDTDENAITFLYFLNQYANKLKENSLIHSVNGNIIEVSLNVNFSDYDQEEIASIFGVSQISVSEFRNAFEKEGYVCVEY